MIKQLTTNLLYLLIIVLALSCKTTDNNKLIASQSNNTIEALQLKIDSLQFELSELKSYAKPLNYEPGKAYTRCVMDPTFETIKSEKQYPIYIGKTPNQEGINDSTFQVSPVHMKWIKKKSSLICDASNTADDESCVVWHFAEIPPALKTVSIVYDTAKIKDFEWRHLEVKTLVKETRISELREFICPTVFHSGLVKKIQDALRNKGYNLVGAKENRMDQITKNALIEYQKKNNLQIGNLNFETLSSLGIEN